MSPERRSVSAEVPEESFGSLGSCLVEGNPEQQVRERRLRHRALILSVLSQSVVLTLLVLAPLFARPENIDLKTMNRTPLPPYGHRANTVRGERHASETRHHIDEHGFVFHPPIPNAPIQQHDDSNVGDESLDDISASNFPSGPGCSSCIDIGSKNAGPPPPQAVETPARPRIIRVEQIDPGMLVHRVEPRYPPLAIQTHREGRVELRAIIATDGSIESLQIVVSDPLFNQSALDAVQQWHYRPTMLNGQPVRVDTYITVFYKMPH